VSVIVPAYNAAGCLERALNSALAQTMADLEVIVVDDGSQDTTLEVARRVAARDSRVRVFSNEHNRGVAESRNRAVKAARGEWIAVLDADDVWFPKRLERMLNYANEADVVSDNLRVVCKSYIRPGYFSSFSLLRSKGLVLNRPSTLSLLDFVSYDLGVLQPIIRRSFLQQHLITYNTSMRVLEDFYFYFEILTSGARWVQLPCAYYVYIGGHAAHLTADTNVLWTQVIECYRSLRDHPAIAGDSNLVAAVNRRIREGYDTMAAENIMGMLRQHRFIDVSRHMLKQPGTLWVFLAFVLNRFYLRGVLSRKFPGEEYMVRGSP
jgi:succinoglycan biosynthesis protein ExoO